MIDSPPLLRKDPLPNGVFRWWNCAALVGDMVEAEKKPRRSPREPWQSSVTM